MVTEMGWSGGSPGLFKLFLWAEDPEEAGDKQSDSLSKDRAPFGRRVLNQESTFSSCDISQGLPIL